MLICKNGCINCTMGASIGLNAQIDDSGLTLWA